MTIRTPQLPGPVNKGTHEIFPDIEKKFEELTVMQKAEARHKAKLIVDMMEHLAMQMDAVGNFRKPPKMPPHKVLELAEKCLDTFIRLVYKDGVREGKIIRPDETNTPT